MIGTFFAPYILFVVIENTVAIVNVTKRSHAAWITINIQIQIAFLGRNQVRVSRSIQFKIHKALQDDIFSTEQACKQ